MALIQIDRGAGVIEQVDETELVRTDGVLENDDERTTWVEYRFPDSDLIVHRSVHVTLKKWPEGMGAVQGTIGG